MNSKFYSVAGITIEVRSDFSITGSTFHPKFKQFEVDGPGDDNVVINHHFHVPEDLILKNDECIFSNELIKIYKRTDKLLYKLEINETYRIYQTVYGLFNLDHTECDIYIDNINKEDYSQARFYSLTMFNSDHLLFSRLLSSRSGLIVHANGLHVNGNVVLLSGASGTGKTTLSAMMEKQGHKIICDDRMLIKKENNDFLAAGSWCHGSVPRVCNVSEQLKCIFFLEHSVENRILRITSKFEIVQELLNAMGKSLIPAEEWKKMLGLIDEIASNIRCYRIKFDLSGQICGMISEVV
jgi:hypothetical protein